MNTTRVIIVDDEPIAAKATAYMIRKNFPEIKVAEIFHSGREAVRGAASLHPDIVIMDIEMPGINGLEAMRQIQTQFPGVKFIIISAYSKFHYAVDAMGLGASDYLLKPVRQKDFDDSFRKVLSEITTERAHMEQTLLQQEKMELLTPMLTQDFIYSFLPGSEADERLIACASFLGILNSYGYVVAFQWRGGAGEDIYNRLSHQLSDTAKASTVLTGLDRAVAYIEAPVIDEKTDSVDHSTIWLSHILPRFSGVNVTAGVGGCYRGALLMKQSCKEAFLALEVLRKEDRGESIVHIVEARKSKYFDAKGVETFQPKDSRSEARRIVDRVNVFLQENFAKDITLEEVAGLVNLSPYYFSRFYKESSGMNYSDKLVLIRMEKAKEFLEKKASVKDAAYMTGYKDPNYFSKVFKKEVGVTPREYRNLHQKK